MAFLFSTSKYASSLLSNITTIPRKFSRFAKPRETSPEYYPKTLNQKKYVNYLADSENKIIIGVGPAGTGKTLFACLEGIKQLQHGSINKIIMTRPIVPVEEDLGFLPGNLNKKMDPWMRPIFDLFLEHYTQRDIDGMLNSNVLEISPLAYMRGRTFKRSLVIADEMQNSSPNQMMMLTTRIGIGSRMVITGDLKQCDKVGKSGLEDFINKFSAYKKNYYANEIKRGENLGIRVVEFEKSDVERSPIVKHVLGIYDSDN